MAILLDVEGVSVKRGPDTCGWENADRKMRMEKNADNKKTKKKKKTRNVDPKKIIIQ